MEGFTPALLSYVEKHNGSEMDRFRLMSTIWLPATLLKSMPGNPILEYKFDSVRTWLESSPLDVRNKEGGHIGVPTIAIGCNSGSYRLIEGNHRAHVMIELLKHERIPVQVVIQEDTWDNPVCEETKLESQDEWETLDNKLLDVLFENGFEHCGVWNRKEVWRSLLPFLIQILLLKEKTKKRRKI